MQAKNRIQESFFLLKPQENLSFDVKRFKNFLIKSRTFFTQARRKVTSFCGVGKRFKIHLLATKKDLAKS